jgi:hypothetical protein
MAILLARWHCILIGVLLACAARVSIGADELVEFGFGKRDITPTLPMRLSGYSDRTEPAKDALEGLNVRSMVIKSAAGNLYAVVSVDLLGLAASHNAELSKRVDATSKIPRERRTIGCQLHSHAHRAAVDRSHLKFARSSVHRERETTGSRLRGPRAGSDRGRRFGCRTRFETWKAVSG